MWISSYSQTCIKRSPLGERKSGLIRQITPYERFNSYEIFYNRTSKRWPFNTGDCLIEVTTWTVWLYSSFLLFWSCELSLYCSSKNFICISWSGCIIEYCCPSVHLSVCQSVCLSGVNMLFANSTLTWVIFYEGQRVYMLLLFVISEL
jgi:hypothetical protein